MWETGAYIAQPLILTAKTGEKIIVWTISSDLETVLPEESYIPTQYLGDGSPDEDAIYLINFFDSQEQKNLGTYYFDEVMSSIEAIGYRLQCGKLLVKPHRIVTA